MTTPDTPPVLPSTTVLIAGATGWLGRKVARELGAAGASLRIGLRHGPAHRDAADLKTIVGAEVVELDLTRPETIPRAVEGVDVIVSAVQGGPEILVDGQEALARAGQAAGVRRIFPSDFAVDFTTIPPEEHLFFAWRRQGQDAIAAIGLPQTNVYNGAFAEVLLPHSTFVLIDWADNEINYWGSAEQMYDFTANDDVARFVAAAATDPQVPDGPLRVAGDSCSPAALADILTRVTGRRFTLNALGTLDDLNDEIALRQSGSPEDPHPWIGMQYLRAMASGSGRLRKLDNGRYPHVAPIGVEAYLARQEF